MAAGFAKLRVDQYQGKVTAHLVISSIIAAIGGLIFGYVGVPGNFPFSSFKFCQLFSF